MTDLTGEFVGLEHRYPLRVYYSETDAGGVVYYASYLSYAERARTEMLRLLGIDLKRLVDESGFAFVVRRLEADYLRPAKLDDVLAIVTRLLAIHAAFVEMEQIIRRGEEDLVRMTLKLAYVKLGGPPLRLPAEMRALLQGYVKETD